LALVLDGGGALIQIVLRKEEVGVLREKVGVLMEDVGVLM